MKATCVLETDDTLQALFLKVGQLPQCQTVFLGNLEGPGFVNLLTGQVVGRRFVESASPSEEGGVSRSLDAILVSCIPLANEGDARICLTLRADGAKKLLQAWTAQALALGLKPTGE